MSVKTAEASSLAHDEAGNVETKIETLELELSKMKEERKKMKKSIEVLTQKLKRKKEVNNAQKEYIEHQNVFTSELMTRIGKVDPSVRVLLNPGLEICNFCFYAAQRGQGGICPCRKVGYCSKTCQKIDWHRRHKCTCPFGVIDRCTHQTKDSDLYSNNDLLNDDHSTENNESDYEDDQTVELQAHQKNWQHVLPPPLSWRHESSNFESECMELEQID